MTENQHNKFTSEAAVRASEMFRGSPGKRVKESGEQSMHLKALGSFVPHEPGKISPQETQFIVREVENAMLQGEDPTEYVSWIASTMNEVNGQALLNMLKNRPKPLSFYQNQVDDMILAGKDPTPYINSVSDKLNDTDKYILFEYLNGAKLVSGIGSVGLLSIREAGDVTESDTAG